METTALIPHDKEKMPPASQALTLSITIPMESLTSYSMLKKRFGLTDDEAALQSILLAIHLSETDLVETVASDLPTALVTQAAALKSLRGRMLKAIQVCEQTMALNAAALVQCMHAVKETTIPPKGD